MRELALTSAADHRGRGPFADSENPEQLMMPENFPAGRWFLERARELGVEKSKPADLIKGRDLFNFGFNDHGVLWGEIIKLSNELRDDKNFTKDMFFQLLCDINNEQEAIDKLKSFLSEN